MRIRSHNISKNHPATVASGPQLNAQGAVRTVPTATNETLEKLLWWFVG